MPGGNVRELRNAADRFVLGLPLGGLGNETVDVTTLSDAPLSERVGGAYERHLIVEALKQQGDCRTRTAEFLGVGRKTLYDKMSKYKLD